MAVVVIRDQSHLSQSVLLAEPSLISPPANKERPHTEPII